MDDVLEKIVGVPRGDEPLHTFDVPGAVTLIDRLGACRADVGPGVRFGEDHGGAPIALHAQRRPVALLSVADAVQHVKHGWPCEIEERRWLPAEKELVDCATNARRSAHAADGLGQRDPRPTRVHPDAD